jgi:hypothetical protein
MLGEWSFSKKKSIKTPNVSQIFQNGYKYYSKTIIPALSKRISTNS